MKLTTFEVDTPLGAVRRLGAAVSQRIVDVNLARRLELAADGRTNAEPLADAELPPDMLAFLGAGNAAIEQARRLAAEWGGGRSAPSPYKAVWNSNDVTMLAPLPRPNTIRDFSTYFEHALKWAGGRRKEAWLTRPSCYKGNPDSVIGPADPISWPRYSRQLDLELELACVIGEAGRNIPIDRTHEHIAGYTILVDVSARDAQWNDWLGPYKGKDFCNVLGPYLVTPDEFDPGSGRCEFKVDGETWWAGDLGEPRHFTVPHLIAYASEEEELQAGDIIATGTIGKQCSLDTDRWVQPGQTVELSIEGIGTLKHEIASPDESAPSLVRSGVPGLLEYEIDDEHMATNVRFEGRQLTGEGQ